MTPWTRFKRPLLGAIFFVALPGSAAADDKAQAKALFTKGQEAYALGHYDKAITHYEAAYRAFPKPELLFNIAQAHRLQYPHDNQIGHLRTALRQYQAFLTAVPDSPNRGAVKKLIKTTQADLARAEKELAALKRAQLQPVPEYGRLVVRSQNAEAATLTVAGEAWGTLPQTRDLKPGSYRVEVGSDGFLPWAHDVEIVAGETQNLEVMLIPEQVVTATAQAEEPPFYRKWWFWTIVGVVAAGTAAGIAVAATSGGGEALPVVDLR